jgi:hypothetical protein
LCRNDPAPAALRQQRENPGENAIQNPCVDTFAEESGDLDQPLQ